MEKIIKQLSVLGVAGAMALTLGCDLDVEDPHHLAGNAPDSIDGKSANSSIITGDGDLNATGNFTVTYSAPNYTLTGAMGDDTGTYNYTRQGPNTALIVYNSNDGEVVTATSIFTSPTAGTYSAVQITPPGTQNGTFTILP